MDLEKLMQQATQMQEQMQSMQAGLADKEVEATVGGGKVTVTANGAGDVTSIRIDPAVVDPGDVEMLEDLVLTGVKQAIEQGRNMAAEEMKKVSGGLGLPPGLMG